jgi:glucuronokinase
MRTPQYVALDQAGSYHAPVISAGVERVVHARVGLVGNPSDGYGGAVLATVVPGLQAVVRVESSDTVSFVGPGVTDQWPSLDAWRHDVQMSGHGDEQRIISASLWSLVEHLRLRGRIVDRAVALHWSTTIARSVGLAGSSALAVGVIDATATAWGIDLDRRVIAALALSAERDVLGIAAGWQDRIVQSFGRTVLVDTSSLDDVDGVSVPRVHLVAAHRRPVPLLIAWSPQLASSSDDYHAPLRAAAVTLEPAMNHLAALARDATTALERDDLPGLAAAIDAGWLARQSCAPLHPDHAVLVESVRSCGLPATTPGSGGAVVALCIDAAATDRAVDALERAQCTVARFDAP